MSAVHALPGAKLQVNHTRSTDGLELAALFMMLARYEYRVLVRSQTLHGLSNLFNLRLPHHWML
jgi:hypothetical protein